MISRCALIAALWGPLVAAEAAENPFLPVSREEAVRGEILCLTGVVTCVAYWQANSFVLASPDDPNGPSVYVTGEHPKNLPTPVEDGPLRIGDLAAVEGVRTPMFFAPGVAARRIAKVGSCPLPKAPVRRLADFFGGRLDNRRVSLEGVVHEVCEVVEGQSSLRLFTPDGFVDVRLPVPMSDLTCFVDSEVSVSGLGMSRFNHRAEFLGVRLEVASLADVQLLKESTADPFAQPLTEIPFLLSWTPQGNDGHIRRIVGEVTAVVAPDVFYLQDGATGVKVSQTEGELPALGARVEVVGFPELIDGAGEMRSARWRTSEMSAPKCEPVELSLQDLVELPMRADNTYKDLDYRLVKVCGRLYRQSDRELVLEVGEMPVRVLMPSGVPQWIRNEEANEPLVEATGVVRLRLESSAAGRRRMEIASVELIVCEPEDLVLRPDAQWRRSRLIAWWQRVLNASLVVVVLLIVTVFVLLFKARQRKREARLLETDRRRMAGDLHDTIEQHLAGAKILLTTALRVPEGMKPAAESAVTVAAEVLLEAKRQIRDVILNLRNEELMQKPLNELIRSVAESVNRQGATRVRVKLLGFPKDLHAGAKTDVVAIVQQAITNAVSHGKARNVVVASDPGCFLRVANDGEPFDPLRALGPDAGHFGLSSMRERAKRSGFSFSIGTEGKWTIVRLERL